MNETLENLLLWIHVLCMVGAFGAMLTAQIGLPVAARRDAETVNGPVRFGTLLIAVGLVAGLATCFIKIKLAGATGTELATSVHVTVGIKFGLLIAVGACAGMALGMVKKGAFESASSMRWFAVGPLALAAFLGVRL